MVTWTAGQRLASRRALTTAATLAASVTISVGAALPAWAADSVTLTFVRHAESFGNIPGATLNTKVPGPILTPLGEEQALDIAPGLAAGAFDGIYYSDMIRTYQTALPLMGLQPDWPTEELGGFREISAGIFEGVPIDEGFGRIGYFLIPLTWGLGLRSIPIPLGEGGNEFQDRYSDAVATVIANGDTNPVIFSHGAAIMVWTTMNVDNPDIGLLLSHPLGNTEEVVLTGNEEDGWMMQTYAGIPVNQNPGLLTQLFVNARDLVVAPQTAVYNVVQAIGTFNLQNIAVAVVDGVISVVRAGIDFVVNSVTDIVNAIIGILPGAPAPASVKAVSATPAVPGAAAADTAAAAVPVSVQPVDAWSGDEAVASAPAPQSSAASVRAGARDSDSHAGDSGGGDTASSAKSAAESSRRMGGETVSAEADSAAQKAAGAKRSASRTAA